MKKFLFFIIVTFLMCQRSYSQDLIITKDAQRIEAKITEVSDDAVRYKKFSNPDGPAFVIKAEKISSIVYQNGEVQVFQTADKVNTDGGSGENCFDVVNEKTDVQNFIVVHNNTSSSYDLRLYGTSLKNGTRQLICQDKILNKYSKKLVTTLDGGRLDHFASFHFCSNSPCNFKNTTYVRKKGKSLQVFLYESDDNDLNVTVGMKQHKDNDKVRYVTIELWFGNTSKLFESDWVRIFSANNYGADKARPVGRPNFTFVEEDVNDHYIVTDDDEEALEFIDCLLKADGDAIIEYEVKTGKKDSVVETKRLSKEWIDNFVEAYKSLGGELKKSKK